MQASSRLGASKIWQHQRDAYCKLGPASWSQKGVPFQISSNALLAKQYAEVALEQLRKEPTCFLELGGGSGRFAYLFLQELLPHAKKFGLGPVRYILTDLAEKNVLFWQSHPLFAPFLKSKVLETHIYNPLVSPPNFLNCRPFVIANYFFDSIEQDLFRVERGQLFEGRITLNENNEAKYSYHPIETLDYYPDLPELNEVLDDYRKQLSQATFLIPIGAIRTLCHLAPGLLLTGDKGFSSQHELAASSNAELVRHETISFPVNFHAIGEYVRKAKGCVLSPQSPHPLFSVHGFSFEENLAPRIQRAFCKQFNGFGAQDLFDGRYPHMTRRSLLRRSNYDPLFFLGKIELFGEGTGCKTLEKIERRFFPICQEEALLGSNFALLYEKLGRPDLARACQKRLASLRALPKHQKSAEIFLHGANLCGHVLQIGKMRGVSEAIIANHPKSYKMISANLLELKNLKVFDQILFFAPSTPSKPSKQFTSLLVLEGQTIIREIEQQLPSFKDIVYSDSDLDLFFSHCRKKSVLDPLHYLHFFQELQRKKQITSGQFKHSLKRLVSEGMVAKEDAETMTLEETGEDLFFEIVQECLERHMKEGSEFRGWFPDTATKFDDVRFYSEIIENPRIDYHEEEQTIAGKRFLLVSVLKGS